MTTTDTGVLLGAVEALAELLSEDGATLRVVSVDEHGPSVELAVAFDGVECNDCILAPDQLRDTFSAALARQVGRPVTVVVHDPRRVEPEVASGAIAQFVDVLDPTGVAPDVGALDPGPAAGALRGKTIAIRHDILWRSFDWTVEEWTSRLQAAGATVLTWRRVQGLVGTDYEHAQAEYEAMLARADVAISGLSNCGSCTSWSVRDGLTAAARDLPTVVVATEHFEPLARELAADGGRPGLRVIVLPYPLDTLPEAEVRAHAAEAFPRMLEVLGATV